MVSRSKEPTVKFTCSLILRIRGLTWQTPLVNLQVFNWGVLCLSFVCHMEPDLFSAEQKKVTQGLRILFSAVGGRYMASEKQVSSNLSSSDL